MGHRHTSRFEAAQCPMSRHTGEQPCHRLVPPGILCRGASMGYCHISRALQQPNASQDRHTGEPPGHRLRCGNTHTIELRAPNVGQRSVARRQAALSPQGDRSPAWRTRTLHQMKVDPERLDLHIMVTSSCRWGSARWKCRPAAGLYTVRFRWRCHLWD